jgi:signal transduction histidine kinase
VQRLNLTLRFLIPVGLVLALALVPLVWLVDAVRTRWLAALIGLGALATTVWVVAWFVRRSILRPLGDLAGAIGRMGPWDLDVRAQVERPDEIGRLAEAFNAMVARLRRSNQDYMEVLAFVSHELKHPIASMVTDARVLADGYLGQVTPEQARKLERLAASGTQLLDLVGEYLDLAKIEAGTLELQARPVPFREQVVEPAAALVQAQAQARRIALELCVPEDLEPVECDPHLLKVVLVNLLGNGVKYGREGGTVRLTVEAVPGRLEVAVRNQGPGFPPWERIRLFRKFSRLQDPVLRQRKGTGLGLYTSWHIVQLHGGTMEAASEQGQWAEFSFRLHQPLRWDAIVGSAAVDAGLLEDLPAVDG